MWTQKGKQIARLVVNKLHASLVLIIKIFEYYHGDCNIRKTAQAKTYHNPKESPRIWQWCCRCEIQVMCFWDFLTCYLLSKLIFLFFIPRALKALDLLLKFKSYVHLKVGCKSRQRNYWFSSCLLLQKFLFCFRALKSKEPKQFMSQEAFCQLQKGIDNLGLSSKVAITE